MRNLAAAAILTALLAVAAPAEEEQAAAQAPPAAATIDVGEITAGMSGYGLTVVRGTEPERFEVEVIGVLHRMAPQRNGILVRVSGLNIEESGIVAGMSGSPVYLDGRLAGAIAFGWTWPKQPIGGVTPIGEMETALAAPAPAGQSSPSWESFDMLAVLGEGLSPATASGAFAFGAPDALSGFSAETGGIPMPLVMPALSSQARDVAQKLFPPGRFLLTEGVAAAPPPDGARGDLALAPGSSVFAALVMGDITVGAVGTVTDVRGGDVYAFGHPFLDQADVEIPMYTSEVLTVFPSSYRSFKLATPISEVGAFVRDRSTGIMGVVGHKARMIPMVVTVDQRGERTVFNYRVMRHFALTPQLAAVTAASSVTTLGDVPPGSTISYDINIEYECGRRLSLSWMAAGANSLASAASDVAAALALTMHNPVERLRPSSIRVDALVEPANRGAVIDSVSVRANDVYPGETLEAIVTLRPVLEPPATVVVRLAVPENAAPGRRSLIICDARASDLLDLQEARHRLMPKTVEGLIEVITPTSRPTDVVARLGGGDYGIALDGRELPRLPSSTLSILAAPQASSLSPLSPALKARASTPYVLSGRKAVPVNIKAPRAPE